MKTKFRRTLLRPAVLLLVCTGTAGCYYLQAARGQLEVLGKREPIGEVVASEETPEALARRLELVRRARRFAVDELHLPDNDSYTTYADLGRDYVVWNVFAAPEFSLEAKRWCYPVVGCVSYRGYFSEAAAGRKAAELARRGFDVAVGGVAAYSTLGRFADPVLNTMMRWDDVRLVAVLFHELAHQVVYIKDDTAFNESFATAVEEAGIERWLERHGTAEDLERFRRESRLNAEVTGLVDRAREDLEAIYASGAEESVLRERKAARLAALEDEIAGLLADAGAPGRHWLLAGELNNARLLPIALYEEHVPAFRRMLDDCGGDFACFYGRVRAISKEGSAGIAVSESDRRRVSPVIRQ